MEPDEVLAARQAETTDADPDPVTEALAKGKHAPHLRVVVQTFGVGHVPGETQVRFLDPMIVRNPDPGPPGWGALIVPAGKELGMHLFPDAVAFLVAQLPIVAEEARGIGQVALQHTVLKAFKTWRLFVPNEAIAICSDLAAIVPTS